MGVPIGACHRNCNKHLGRNSPDLGIELASLTKLVYLIKYSVESAEFDPLDAAVEEQLSATNASILIQVLINKIIK